MIENIQFEKIEEQIREESPTKSQMDPHQFSHHTQSIMKNQDPESPYKYDIEYPDEYHNDEFQNI